MLVRIYQARRVSYQIHVTAQLRLQFKGDVLSPDATYEQFFHEGSQRPEHAVRIDETGDTFRGENGSVQSQIWMPPQLHGTTSFMPVGDFRGGVRGVYQQDGPGEQPSASQLKDAG